MASNAVVLSSGRQHSSTSITKTNKIMRAGALVFEFNLYSTLENGKAPSRAMAKPILDVTVILLKPAKNTLTINSAVIATAPFLLYSEFLLVKAATNRFTTA